VSSEDNLLDASVLIAILRNEPYDRYILGLLDGAYMSAINCAEVWTKLHEFGLTTDPRVQELFALLAPIEPFIESQAQLTGDLRPITKPFGLGLGDRACLAVAIETGATLHTAERSWAKLELPCTIRLIR
jgi:ribonuclease VapC